jgi:hypothetical protein
MTEPLIDQSLNLVRAAVKKIGKKPLAARADVSDGILRNVDREDFSPTARTLRKLERVAVEVLAKTEGASV